MQLEALGARVRFVIVDTVCQAHLLLSPGRVRKVADKISKILEIREPFVAETQKLAGALVCAQAQLTSEELLCVRSTTW